MTITTGEYGQLFSELEAGCLVSSIANNVITVAASGDISFGSVVGRVANKEHVGEEWVDNTKQILGIAVASQAATRGLGMNRVSSYVEHDAVSVARKGRIIVQVTGGVKAGDKAYAKEGTGQIIPNSASPDDVFIGRFFTSAIDGGFSELEINIL